MLDNELGYSLADAEGDLNLADDEPEKEVGEGEEEENDETKKPEPEGGEEPEMIV